MIRGLSSAFARRLLSSKAGAGGKYESLVLRYHQHGDPRQMLKLEKEVVDAENLGATQVLIKILAAPINPSDINMVEGTYGIKPPLPAVGGNECVGAVIKTGAQVKDIGLRQFVIPYRAQIGTWRNYAIVDASEIQVVPDGLGVSDAATLGVNPCTAYRLLSDFAKLGPNDVVVQNAATSAVGQAVVQIAKSMGVKTVNIIRKKDDGETAEVRQRLLDLGATLVITDDAITKKETVEAVRSLGNTVLALNAVSGPAAADMVRLLDRNAQCVTYGAMSKKPFTIPNAALIFSNITFRGFWLTEWVRQHSKQERFAMLQALTNLIRRGDLVQNVTFFPFSAPDAALAAYYEPNRSAKILFDMFQ